MYSANNIFRDFIKSKGLKWTPERKAIFDEVCHMRSHFEVDDLLIKLRQNESKVSKGSVYRTIRLLEEAGIIKPVVFTERHTHYENIMGRKHHSHLICVSCGKIIEFSNAGLAARLQEACREYNFKDIDHKIEATGFCKKCRKNMQ